MAGYVAGLPFEPFRVQAKVLKRESGGETPPSGPPPTPQPSNPGLMANGHDPELEVLYSVLAVRWCSCSLQRSTT